MRRRGSRTMLLLGLVVALAVFLAVYVVIGAGPGKTNALPTPTPIPVQVVAFKGDQKAYTILSEQNLTTKQVDPSTVLTTTARTPDQVIGKMTTRAYQDGDAVSLADDALTEPGISQALAQNPDLKGKRAFAL